MYHLCCSQVIGIVCINWQENSFFPHSRRRPGFERFDLMLNQELVLTIMNEIEDLIYVADVNTYDLLYMNEKGSRLFGITDFRNKKCYEALQNRSDPCPFCTNSRLNMDSFYIWEFMNPVVDRYYLLKDKLLLWNGRTVRIEICTDITDTACDEDD